MPVAEIWTGMVAGFGRRQLGIGWEIGTAQTGSGDTTYNYVNLLVMSMLAASACLIWTLLDRKPPA